MAIIDPICLIDDHSLTISSGKGADGQSLAAQVLTLKPTEDPMSIRSTILATAFTLASLGASLGPAEARGLRPIEAQSIHLGDVSGVAYYTVEPDGYRVVTTLSQGEAGTPVRFVSVLAPGQRALLSTPNQAGAVEISRNGDSLTVRKSGTLSN
ncbi:hypothetical protein [Bradyrhizobium quebecense]|uniref:Uncharacterized protein n=2 Tax=Bradyrhizobium quebecense TaxID=2748629 RepID=A0ACD3V4L2_9BRAD|nr:hypothetical protein [Bradyrhizobium quebecense]UGY01020.1 hypothetical protein J4P68_0028400 [Bradyrhizobium quebecense]